MPSEQSYSTDCSFGNSSTEILGGSSFVLSDPEIGSIVIPFSFSWTVSTVFISVQSIDFHFT